MKKTYTTTFHSVINYGAILQTIALQQVIENMGMKNEVIDYTDECMDYYNPLEFRNLNFIKRIKKIVKLVLFGYKTVPKFNKFKKFINKNIKLTEKVTNIQEINSFIEDDAILVTGSDQVWSPDILNGVSDIYALNFGNKTHKRVSYAASIGVEKIDDKYIEEYKNKISRIDSISVREESAKKILSNLIKNKEIEVTLDPTLLLTSGEWNELSKDYEENKSEKYIIAYTMDKNDEYVKIANYLSKQTGYKIVYFDLNNPGFSKVLKNAYNSDPYEFIKILKNAEYVITNSFHGTVFSLIFNKKFWVIPHLKKGTRMINLLTKVKLSNRIVKSLEEFENVYYDEEIDYKKINNILEKERELSKLWLKNSLKK